MLMDVAAYTAYGAQVFAFDLRGDTGRWTSQGLVTGTRWVDPVGVVAARVNRLGPPVPRVYVAQLDAAGLAGVEGQQRGRRLDPFQSVARQRERAKQGRPPKPRARRWLRKQGLGWRV